MAENVNSAVTAYLSILKPAFHNILLDPQIIEHDFSRLSYYSNTIIAAGRSQQLYNELKEQVTIHLKTIIRANVLNIPNKQFCTVFFNIWDDFQKSLKHINYILFYLNEVYIKQNESVDSINVMCNDLFSDLVINYSYILNTIEKQLFGLFNDEIINKKDHHKEIKMMITILMFLKYKSNTPNNCDEPVSIYAAKFKQPIINAFSNLFYKISFYFIRTFSNTILYMDEVANLMHQEKTRIKYYFDEDTYAQIMTSMKTIFIKMHMDTFLRMENFGLIYLFQHKKYQYLRCMYKFLNKIKTFDPMVYYLNMHIREVGRKMVKGISHNSNDFIQNVIDLKKECNEVLYKCFRGNLKFKKAFNVTFCHIMAINPLSAEYLSVFVIDKMKTVLHSIESTNDEEVFLNKAMEMYKYTVNKIVFKKLCHQFFANLFLNNFYENVQPHGIELHLVSLLEANCGKQYTLRFDQMMKDIHFHELTIKDFKEHNARSDERCLNTDNFSMMVLNRTHWPIFLLIKCKLPLVLTNIYNTFNAFYEKRYKQTIILLPNLGKVNLNAVFYGSPQPYDKSLENISMKEYTIQVSTLQSCVLLLFNGRDKLTFKTILAETEIHKTYLKTILRSLTEKPSQSSILLKNPPCENIKLTDEFYINEAFTSESNNVDVQLKEYTYRKSNIDSINTNRLKFIEEIIFRILRETRQITRVKLIEEVKNIVGGFNPSVSEIKKRIKTLIDNGSIAKTPGNDNVHLYLNQKDYYITTVYR